MIGLPRYITLDARVDRLPKPALVELQASRLRAMVSYVYANAPFWRRKLDAQKLAPEDIRGLEDLARIPFCTKSELLEDQRQNPPFGSYVASDPTRWYKLFSTSGTTGQPLLRVFSEEGWNKILDRFHRNSPIAPGDRVMILSPVDGLLGPTAGAEAAARRGGLVIYAGRHDSRGKVELIRQLRPTHVIGAATYLLHLGEVAAELGIDLAKLGVKALASVGEPGAAIPGTRARLEQSWGASVGDGYGMTELFPLGGSCPHSTALHIPDDLVITEIVDPTSGERLPDGKLGEVVFTNLICDTQPLLRYRTRDMARVSATPCPCGFTGTLLQNSIEARVDDMIWYKGLNVFPTAIEAVLRDFAEVGDEFQIVLSGSTASPELGLRVEPACPSPLNRVGQEALAGRLREAIKSRIGINAAIEVVPRGSLPRPDHRRKMRRTVDMRSG